MFQDYNILKGRDNFLYTTDSGMPIMQLASLLDRRIDYWTWSSVQWLISQTATLDDLIITNESVMLEQLKYIDPLGGSDHTQPWNLTLVLTST